jgi:hypothetical protein
MKLTRSLLCLAAVACVSAPALAGLGANATSVEADRARLKGSLQVREAADYAVHEIQTPAGMRVREYVTHDGLVFAVSWRGPAMPDLGQLLGSFGPQLAQARAASTPRYNHHHLEIRTADVVVQSSGYVRAFRGRAWATALLPQNFSPTNIE